MRRSDIDVKISPQDLSVFVFSFNCGEKSISEIDLKNGIPENRDLYIFSLQECLNTRKSIKAITKTLNHNNEYVVEWHSIGSRLRLLGFHGDISIITLVRSTVLERFSLCTGSEVCRGFNVGVCKLGNKGSAAVALRIGNKTLLAIAVHFASDLKVRWKFWRFEA